MKLFEHDEKRNSRLIRRCLEGHSGAWSELIDIYAPLVRSTALRHGLAATEVDDVGQEAFLALAQHLHELENPAALPAWLMTTTRRLAWRALQRSKRDVPIDDDTMNALAAAKPEAISQRRLPSMAELLQGWENQEVLAKGLQSMGERCQQLLHLLFLDQSEPDYDEISRSLGIAKGSIGPTRTRCLNQLRDILLGLGFGQE